MIKLITGLVVWSGVGTIIGTAVKCFTPGNMSKFNKICTTIGGLALTGLVADKTTDYTDRTIDMVIEELKEKTTTE